MAFSVKLIMLCALCRCVTSQQCRYVTVPVCDGEEVTTAGNGATGLKGDKGEIGYSGKPGPPGAKGGDGSIGAKGEKGDANVEELQEHLSEKIGEIQNTLNTLLLPPNCASSSVVGYQQLRSGEFAFCDGGWHVFQQRFIGDVNFQRSWNDYKNGFGNKSADFWLGLENVYQATKGRGCKVRFDLWSFDGDHAFAEYSSFSIEDESDFYRLHVGGYSGTAGDCLIESHSLNGMAFTTMDRDNDRHARNCATDVFGNGGGWWYKACQQCKLNAAWGPSGGDWHNNHWQPWKGIDEALNGSSIKFRCD